MNTLYCTCLRNGYFVCFITFLVVIFACIAVVFYRNGHNDSAQEVITEKNLFVNGRSIMASQDSPGFPHPGLSMECYPETIMPGDTIYYVIIAKNPHEQSIWIHEYFSPTDADIQTSLKNSDSQEQPLLFESWTNAVSARILICRETKPGDSRIIGALAVNLPPLEDIKEPFWEKHLKNLPADGEQFFLCVTVDSYSGMTKWGENGQDVLFTLEVPITIKPRPEKEMAMMEDWYSKTPKMLFPKPPPFGERDQRKTPQGSRRLPKSKNIYVQRWYFFRTKYSQWNFVRLGNRYPSDPNAPETWQGWKALEESLTPSTMRDEIRLTRILIQYCNTKDTKVLTELRQWFDGMNEIQRTVMANHICQLASRNDVLLSPYRKIYQAIRHYNTADESEYWLKDRMR